MGIYIGMKKLGENDETVSYIFDMLIVDQEHFNEGEKWPYKVDSHRAYGYCTFNKKTKGFILNEEKTDPYFIKHKPYVMRVWGKLLDIRESGEKYPIKTCYAS